MRTVTRIFELSMPVITHHVRWLTERAVKGDLSASDITQITTIKVSCHYFTHIDALRHYFSDGDTIGKTPLYALLGDAAVVDLMDVVADQAIEPELLASRC